MTNKKSDDFNIFVDLNRWAFRQNENFITEALVYLLKFLLHEEPYIASKLLYNFTDGFLSLKQEDTINVKVKTQTVIDEGKPDIEIIFNDYLIYIEAKVNSGLSKNQLSGYKSALEKSGIKNTQLIFLSRYPLNSSENGIPDKVIRWYQIADWLKSILRQYKPTEISQFLIRQFIGLLDDQNMVLSKVRSEISSGLNSYRQRIGDVANSLQRMRSFSKLDSDSDLKPLANLLKLMKESLGVINVKPRLESGKSKARFLDLSWYCHTSVIETQKHLSFSVINFSDKNQICYCPESRILYTKYFLACEEHRDRQNPNWKPFQLLERHCLVEGHDFYETMDMIQERIGRRKFYVIFSEINSQIDSRVSGDALEAVR
jgi:hypothetical protein